MEKRNQIVTIEELREKFEPIKNVNEMHRERLSPLDHLALFITQHVGTMGFFFIIFVWTISWLSWNIVGPVELRFDPFPAFVLWLFISNLIQLHLMPLIMVGQNLQNRHAELRSEREYTTSKKAEKEIETILLHLENQEKLIEELHKKLDGLENKK
jgi:uncharacterized membrane protein